MAKLQRQSTVISATRGVEIAAITETRLVIAIATTIIETAAAAAAARCSDMRRSTEDTDIGTHIATSMMLARAVTGVVVVVDVTGIPLYTAGDEDTIVRAGAGARVPTIAAAVAAAVLCVVASAPRATAAAGSSTHNNSDNRSSKTNRTRQRMVQ